MGLKVNFSGGIPFWLAAIIAVAAMALTLTAYFRSRTSAPRGHIVFLTALRVFATAVVLLLALRPLVTYRAETSRQGDLVFLVDTSASMGVRDYPNLPDRLSSVKAAVAADNPWMKGLGERFRLSLYSFDAGLKSQVPLANAGTLSPVGLATDIAGALGAAASQVPGGRYARIVLFTDGVDTSQPKSAYAGSVPVVAVGAGSKLSAEGAFRDIILSRIEVLPEGVPIVSKDNLAAIAAYVEGLGCAGLVVPVRLLDAGGKVLDQQSLTIDARRGDQEVMLSYTPREKGNYKLSVDIPVQGGETIEQNNGRSFNVTVADPRIMLLYVEGTLRWEYRYLKRVIERDPNVRLLALVRLSERTFYQQGNITDLKLTGLPQDLATLKKFNVIVIGDVPSSAFSAADMENIRTAVSEGAGFAMLGGYNSFADGGYAGTPIADVLPVDLAQSSGGQDRNEFVPGLTDLGEVSQIFAGITDYFPLPSRKAAKELPPLLGQVRMGRPKPAASALAVNPLRGDQFGNLPVLVTQNYGSGRVLAFAGDTTWRWYAPLVGQGVESPYVKLWSQMVRWLAQRRTEEDSGRPGATAFLDKAFYAPGDKVTITAEVRDAEGLLTDKAVVDASVEPGGLKIPLALVVGSKGTYSGAFDAPGAGSCKVTVKAAKDKAVLGESVAAFDAQAEDIEMRRIDLDEDNLRNIAARSAGLYLPLVDFPSYAANLRAEGETQTIVEVLNLRQKRVLWPLLLAFVVLVTVEWIWRKRLELP